MIAVQLQLLLPWLLILLLVLPRFRAVVDLGKEEVQCVHKVAALAQVPHLEQVEVPNVALAVLWPRRQWPASVLFWRLAGV